MTEKRSAKNSRDPEGFVPGFGTAQNGRDPGISRPGKSRETTLFDTERFYRLRLRILQLVREVVVLQVLLERVVGLRLKIFWYGVPGVWRDDG